MDVLLHAGAVLDAGRQDREAREIPTEQRQFLNTAPLSARGRGLRVLQRDALDQHDVAVGVQRSFAETVDAYIERKLAEE